MSYFETNCFTLGSNVYVGSQIDRFHNTSLLAKFSLMIPGDTVSSSRIYEAFTSNTIPIIMSDSIMQYGIPFLSIVPWKDIVFFVHTAGESDEEISVQLQKVAAAPEYLLRKKLRMIQLYKQDVLWNIEGSRVTENIMQMMRLRCL